MVGRLSRVAPCRLRYAKGGKSIDRPRPWQCDGSIGSFAGGGSAGAAWIPVAALLFAVFFGINGAGGAMSRNVEIKARIPDVAILIPRAAAIADQGPIEIVQDDTFFHCRSGRLKLRSFSKDEGELIFYRRADQQGPKESFYLRTPTTTPEILRQSLSLACGEIGRVRKHRTLFLVGRTRIHLDIVEDLGHFLELEVVLDENEPVEVGAREAEQLMARLGIQESQLIERAYVDLLADRHP
jgi:predicted adenylyl cyclase CyaB